MAITSKFVNVAIATIIVIVVLFQAYATIVPEAQSAGDEMGDEFLCTELGACIYNATANETYPCRLTSNQSLNCTGGQVTSIPLSGLFDSSGIVFLIVMIALLIVIVKGNLKK